MLGGPKPMDTDYSTDDRVLSSLNGSAMSHRSMNSDKKRDIRSAEKNRDGEDTASMDDMGTFLGSLTQASGELSSPPRTKRLDDRRFLDSPARNTRSTKKSPTRQPVISSSDQRSQQDATFSENADVQSSRKSHANHKSSMKQPTEQDTSFTADMANIVVSK
eukprot:scaffold6526_cov163-Cylindrotheca_fusiformis.AAC.1